MFCVTSILLTIIVTTSPLALLVHANLPPGLTGDAWGQEYCRQGLCAIMAADRWHWCCEHYRRCCAYVEYVRPHDPFYFEKHEEVSNKFSSRSQKPKASPQEPPASTQEPPANPQEPPASAEELSTEVDQPSRSSRLQEDPLLVLEEQPRSQPQPQPPSYSQTKPSPHPAQTRPRPQAQPPRSYNDVLRRGDEKMCRAKFCGLLTQRKHRRCCDLYRQCCAYADLRKVNDPFFYDKHPVYV